MATRKKSAPKRRTTARTRLSGLPVPQLNAAEQNGLRDYWAIAGTYILFDQQWRYLYVNLAAVRSIGRPREQILGRTLWELYPDIIGTELERQYRHAMQQRESVSFEFYYSPTNTWWENHFYPAPEGLAVFATNITERKRTEETLKESEERFRTFIEQSNDGVVMVDEQGMVAEWNQAQADITGIPRSDAIGLTFWEIQFKLVPPEHRSSRSPEFFRDSMQSFFATGQSPRVARSFEVEIMTSTGKRRTITQSWFPIKTDKGYRLGSIVRDITDQKRAEEAIRKSEQVLREAESIGHTGSWEQNLITGKIFNTEENLRLFFGDDRSKGEPFEDYAQAVYPDDREYVLQRHVELLEGGPGDIEYRVVWPDGSIHVIFGRATVVRDESGQAIRVYGTNVDITERKQAEEALRQSQANLVAAQRITHLGSWELDLSDLEDVNANPLRWSDEVFRIFGYEPGGIEVTNENFFRAVHPDDRSRISDAIAATLKSGEPYSIDHRIIRPDGTERIVHEQSEVVYDKNNRPLKMVGTVQDVTESRRADQARLESERQIRALVNSLDDIVFEFDQQGTYLNVWGTNENLLARPRTELFGRRIEDALGERIARPFTEALGRVLSTGQTEDVEYSLELASGRHWFLAHINPILSSDGSHRTASMLVRDITSRKQAERALDQHLAELEMLYESGLALGQLLEPEQIGQKVIDLMGRRLNWHHNTIRLYHPESQSLELLAFDQPDTNDKTELKMIEERFQSLITRPGQGLSGTAVQTGEVIRVTELSREPRYIEIIPDLHSGMYVPMKIGDRVVGIISVESERPNAFSESDERLTVTLANQAAVALENARLHKETMRQVEQLQALHAIDQTITASLDLNMTLNVVLEQVIRQLNIDAAAILLLEPGTQRLEFVSGKGFRTALIESSSLRLGEGLAGKVALDRRTVHREDLDATDESFARPKLLVEENFVSYHAVPLITKGKVKGVLEIFNRSRHIGDEKWRGFLEALGTQAAIAIDNSFLFQDLQRSNLDLVLAYDATIEGWSRALDLRDKETEGHTQRVTETTLKLARAMGLRDEELIQIRRGALLHDIGKMGVPDNILLKPGKLTEAEWIMMRRHPSLAYEMLRPIAYLRSALDIPYYHHEKWDGSGYPQGLKGEQIPLAARIFAVVDVWDALSFDRPYRAAWAKEEVLKYIQEQSGKHFDPKVVQVFLEQIANS